MIELTNDNVQILAPGQSVVFNTVVLQQGCGECHRRNSSAVKLRSAGVYDISFSANIGSSTAEEDAELTIQLGGENLPETRMVTVSVAAGDINNVSRDVPVKINCCDYDRLTVTNTGTTTINVVEPVLFIRKTCRGC